MKNARILLAGVMVVVLAAGVVAGMLASRLPASGAGETAAGDRRSALEEELGLTPKQREEMRRIWENVRDQVNDCDRAGRDLPRQRDNEIIAMLTDEQKVKFEKIAKDYHQREIALKQEREGAFGEGVNKTNEILTKPQQEKYSQIIKARLGHVPSTEAGVAPVVSP